MTKTLYLMSDPETLFDTTGKLQGWSDMPLTQQGVDQARSAGQGFLARLAARPDTLVASTSERASDALEISWRAAYGETPRYERTKGLKGLNYGPYEGWDRFLAPQLPPGDFFVRFGGESEAALRRRALDTLLAIMRRSETQVAFVASHADLCFAFLTLCDTSRYPRMTEYEQQTPPRLLGDGYRGCQVYGYAFDSTTERFSYRGVAWDGTTFDALAMAQPEEA